VQGLGLPVTMPLRINRCVCIDKYSKVRCQIILLMFFGQPRNPGASTTPKRPTYEPTALHTLFTTA
jgi:hypothetical protein